MSDRQFKAIIVGAGPAGLTAGYLKVGDWIVQNRALPHTGILSRTAVDRPWVAYSWGYEVLLSRAYAWFGLIGIGAYGTLLTVVGQEVLARTGWSPA